MKIKVCGMRDVANIRALQALNIDYMGLIFYKKSARYVNDINSCAGIIPNLPRFNNQSDRNIKSVGVFVDEMPQEVITHAYNYHLDCIQLHGNESPTYIDNLKRSLVPDILPEITIIKAISIKNSNDISKWQQYRGHVDMLLFDTKCESKGGSGTKFDWDIINLYDGDIPFLLSGGIGPDDAEAVKALHHKMCIGIDINSKFESAPAIKNIEAIKTFINKLEQP